MNKRFAGGLIAAVLLLNGCSSSSSRAAREANPAPCPNVIVLKDASRIVEFDGEESLEDIAFTGEITNINIACRYFEDKPIDAEVTLDFAFGKGPKAADQEKIYKYFVAVTRQNLEVIAKKEFAVRAKFGEKNSVVFASEEIDEIHIPRSGENISGTNFEIIVGFSLDREQIIFNRSGKSLKFPTL